MPEFRKKPAEQRYFWRQNCYPYQNEEDSLKDGQKKPYDTQHHKKPAENMSQNSLHLFYFKLKFDLGDGPGRCGRLKEGCLLKTKHTC